MTHDWTADCATATQRLDCLRIALAHMPGTQIADVIAAAREIERYLTGAGAQPTPAIPVVSDPKQVRDRKIVEMVNSRFTNIEIAKELGIRETHIPMHKRRLGLHTRQYKYSEAERERQRQRARDMREANRKRREAASG